jgi:SAC3 family protein LENG8/THP3
VPWSTGKIKNGFDRSKSTLNDRASRFAGRGGLADINSKSKSTLNFDKYKGAATIGGSNKKLDEQDYERMTVKGTCKTLEKAYLRLTAPPKAEQVRPRRVLKLHLANLKAERDQASRRDYLWFCSQFKAIRQDCTVQRIQDTFTVDVYETHARVALEESDMNEFNQCQTQLIQLYKRLTDPMALRHQNEFLGYRILYQTFVVIVNGGGSSDLLKTMLSVTHSQQQQDPIIRHALAVRRASSGGDYHAFFRLYKKCPTVWSEYLMDGLVPAVRFDGLKCIAKSYRPAPVAVDFVLQQLGLLQQRGDDDDDEREEEESTYGRNWLVSCGCKLSKDGADVLTNETEVHQSTMDEKQSLI